MKALRPPPSQPGGVPPDPRTSSQRTSQTPPSPRDNPDGSTHTSNSGIVVQYTSWRVFRDIIIKIVGINKTIFYFFSNLCYF